MQQVSFFESDQRNEGEKGERSHVLSSPQDGEFFGGDEMKVRDKNIIISSPLYTFQR